MSVFDATAVNLAATGASEPPAAGGAPAPAEGQPKDGEAGRPAGNDLIHDILDKHGLTSAEDLGEFIDNLAGLKGKLGDLNPDELIEAHKTLQSYHKEWSKQEREKQKEKETPEETIKRLESELESEQARKQRTEQTRKQSETAKEALATYGRVVQGVISADQSIPEEYHPFLKELLGVGSPVNEVDITDKAAARKLTREYGIKKLKEFEQLIIKRYREGKSGIPAVPPPAGGSPPVTAETKPKNLKESRALAHTMLSRLWGGGGQ